MPKGRLTNLKPRANQSPARTKTVNTDSWLGADDRHKNFYGTYRWRKAALDFLRKNPLCKHCLDAIPQRITPANTVDHIQPHRGDTRLFWLVDNWQALCASCHSKKTASGQGQRYLV